VSCNGRVICGHERWRQYADQEWMNMCFQKNWQRMLLEDAWCMAGFCDAKLENNQQLCSLSHTMKEWGYRRGKKEIWWRREPWNLSTSEMNQKQFIWKDTHVYEKYFHRRTTHTVWFSILNSNKENIRVWLLISLLLLLASCVYLLSNDDCHDVVAFVEVVSHG
jgi:hypothetical protein